MIVIVRITVYFTCIIIFDICIGIAIIIGINI